MIKIKHLFDPVEPDDGARIWVEPVRCTRDFIEWGQVNHQLCHIGPPLKLWNWFQGHPDGYERFRGMYHQWLNTGPFRKGLMELACASRRETFTLLHQGQDPQHNSATALWEYITELEAYCPTE